MDMLNIQNLTRTIQFTEEDAVYINELKSRVTSAKITGTEKPKKFSSLAEAWDSKETKNIKVKESIKTQLQGIQGQYCIYCGRLARDFKDLEREHIAPKAKYPQFTYTPENLVLACSDCNGFVRKGDYDSIYKFDQNYDNCEFKIIHPYKDKIEDYIEFDKSDDSIVLRSKDVPGTLNPKGAETIRLFDLNDIFLIQYRFTYKHQIKYPINEENDGLLKKIMGKLRSL